MTKSHLSPNGTARIAGALYMIVVVCSIFALGSISGILESGDPAATQRNLSAHSEPFRVAVVANLVAALCYVGVIGLLNELLKPVQAGISRIAVLFGLGGCIIGAATAAMQLAAATLSANEASAVPVHALLVAGGRANSVALTFFGCYCLLLGWLVFRSEFIPKVFGMLLMLSGVSWLVGNLAILAKPDLASRFLIVVGVAALGEIVFTLWLLLKGVDVRRWEAGRG